MNYLETIYYITAGPGLLLIGYLALSQIKVSKENAKIAAKRESYRLAAEQLSFFSQIIIPRINIADNYIKENGILFFKNSTVQIESSNIKIVRYLPKGEKEKIINFVAETDITETFNLTESVAIYFTGGLASEELAFSSIGYSYVYMVKKFLPLILINEERVDYKNLIDLFILWSNRIENQNLIEQKKSLDKKIVDYKYKSISPIGVND